MLRFVLLVFLSSFSIHAKARCDFVEAEYIEELNSPKHIKSINIEIPKSAKFARNALKIIVSRSENIKPELKKRFDAIVTVKYEFGSCVFDGSVRQNGDWKDHITFISGGKVTQSLDVKLFDGNILNSVRFKLLIPSTRGGTNEILGVLLLRKLGFIAPETFEVLTNVNGVPSTMLFQENARKELLERNHKREGPIFEGDETLLWSYKDYDLLVLEHLALVRMTNNNWFEKGESSEEISIGAFNKLQRSYLAYSQSKDVPGYLIFPNNNKSTLFSRYFLTLVAMNGEHALRPHNRKYYFNSFEQQFEPIYYDGDLSFSPMLSAGALKNSARVISKMSLDSDELNEMFSSHDFRQNEEIFNEFLVRTKLPASVAESFFNESISQFHVNIQEISSMTATAGEFDGEEKDQKDLLDSYVESQKSFELTQILFTSIERQGDSFVGRALSGELFDLSVKQVSKILSKNTLNGERAVLLGNRPSSSNKTSVQTSALPLKVGGSLTHSKTLKIAVDPDRKQMIFTQTKQGDWVLVRDANLKDWKVIIRGSGLEATPTDGLAQRFNQSGMTGCLNFYNSYFDKTTISSDVRDCEDSVNFVNSNGNITSIEVVDAFADAIDMDFSSLSVSEINVERAGNDCLDVSGGKYVVQSFLATECGDKGLSVGEGSDFEAMELIVSDSILGVSSKDYSVTKIGSAQILETPNCFESTSKKQEFGGARLEFGSLVCAGSKEIDPSSTAKVNE